MNDTLADISFARFKDNDSDSYDNQTLRDYLLLKSKTIIGR